MNNDGNEKSNALELGDYEIITKKFIDHDLLFCAQVKPIPAPR